jgi:phosphopantothenoylcysteine decarboxylase/phosphopantothenate--cysteine ligase
MLKGKKIVLGVTGGIAAYKAAEFVRLLVKAEAGVHVVMTRHAQEFITPLTFQTLSGNPVVTDAFSLLEEAQIGHVALADLAELIVILPATANIIGKIANGIADDFLSTMVMASRAPVLVVPSMNVNMWENPAVQKNMEVLLERGIHFVEPGTGELACHWYGKGRLADLEDVLESVEDLFSPKDLKGERILITAGPTQEPIDPIRYISNRSSGKMGYALARMARRRGAEVVLVTGPTQLPPPRKDIEFVSVRTAEEMREAVLHHFDRCTAVMKAAAVADYRPREISPRKIKKGEPFFSLEMEKTSDILEELGRRKEGKILIGFAAESENLLKNAQAKLQAKKLDLIIANEIDVSFGRDTNQVKIIYPTGKTKDIPPMNKEDVADILLDEIVQLRHGKKT